MKSKLNWNLVKNVKSVFRSLCKKWSNCYFYFFFREKWLCCCHTIILLSTCRKKVDDYCSNYILLEICVWLRNCRTTLIENDLWRSSGPTPCSGKAGCSGPALEHLQGWRLFSTSVYLFLYSVTPPAQSWCLDRTSCVPVCAHCFLPWHRVQLSRAWLCHLCTFSSCFIDVDGSSPASSRLNSLSFLRFSSQEWFSLVPDGLGGPLLDSFSMSTNILNILLF